MKPTWTGDIGVFGGTFDPVHVGHLVAATEALHALALEAVLFVPAADPPHKRTRAKTTSDHRIAMLALAIAGNERLAISRVDVDRPGPHYTVDMLAQLRDEHPQARLHFLMGSDSLAELATWHEPQRLPQLACLVVLNRPGEPPDLVTLEAVIPGLRSALRVVAMPPIGISGTDLRQRVVDGRPIRYQVAESVRSYIERHGLYHEAPTAARPAPTLLTGALPAAPRLPLPMAELLIATTNAGKLAELAALAEGLAERIRTPSDLGLALRVAEEGTTWWEHALAKAKAYAQASGLPALADDSGLEVDALGGQPGLQSARWLQGSDAERWRSLLARMRDVPWEKRTARYTSATAIAWPDGHAECAQGSVEGRIAWAPRGKGGFGYDPVFLVEDAGYGGHVSMAELPMAEKNFVSHRGRAVRRLLAALAGNPSQRP